MRALLIGCSWGLLGALAVTACGGVAAQPKRDPSTIVVPENVTEADFASLIGEIGCNAVSPCCAQSGYEDDALACGVNFAGRFALYPRARFSFDGKLGTQCLKALQQNTVACGHLPAPCSEVYRGTAAIGDSCALDSECDSRERTVTCATLGSGVCMLMNEGELGDPCDQTCQANGERWGNCMDTFINGNAALPANTHVACERARGLYCDVATAKCKSLVDVSSACSASTQCVVGAWCLDSACQPLVALGLSCSNDFECMGDAYCGSDHTCQTPETKADGEACSSPIECIGDTCEQGQCTNAFPAFIAEAVCGPRTSP